MLIVRLAVLIVSYNTRELLGNCLESLERAAGSLRERVEIEVVVVDNASADQSAEMVAERFPAVRLIALDRNIGFPRANNLALATLAPPGAGRAAQEPDYFLLLNPDTVVTADALAAMLDLFLARPAAGVVGARLQYGDGRFQHGAFAFPGLAQVWIDLFLPASLPAAHRVLDSRLNGRYPVALWNAGAPFGVDFVLGAALMARTSLYHQLGGLDEGYFMYCEEMDWCLRAHEAGWEVLACPAAVITHFEGQSSRQAPWESMERLWRSRLRFYAKNRRRFAPWTGPLVRMSVRLAMERAAARAMRRFAQGRVNGVEVAAEIRARTTIGRIEAN